MPDLGFSPFLHWSCFILTRVRKGGGNYYEGHFINGETEVQRKELLGHGHTGAHNRVRAGLISSVQALHHHPLPGGSGSFDRPGKGTPGMWASGLIPLTMGT